MRHKGTTRVMNHDVESSHGDVQVSQGYTWGSFLLCIERLSTSLSLCLSLLFLGEERDWSSSPTRSIFSCPSGKNFHAFHMIPLNFPVFEVSKTNRKLNIFLIWASSWFSWDYLRSRPFLLHKIPQILILSLDADLIWILETMAILCNSGRKRDRRRRRKEKEKDKTKAENHQCCCCCVWVWPTFSMVRGIKRCLFLSCYPFIRCLGFEERRHCHHLHNFNHFLWFLTPFFVCVICI